MAEQNLPVWHVMLDAEDLGKSEYRFVGTKEDLLKNLEWTCKGFVRGKDIVYSYLDKGHEIIAFATGKNKDKKTHSMNLYAVEVTALPDLYITTKEEYEHNQAEDRMYGLE